MALIVWGTARFSLLRIFEMLLLSNAIAKAEEANGAKATRIAR
jgi:hypothetical protein